MPVEDAINELVQAVPSDRLWFDPGMLNVATSIRMTTVTLATSVAKQMVPQDPTRWAFGFFQSSLTTNLSIAPWPDVGSFVFDSVNITAAVKWYNLFTYGILVSNAWWGLSPSNVTLRCVELLRN